MFVSLNRQIARLLLQSNIKKYRTEKKLSQEVLSEKAGISCDYLSEIERGRKTPSIKRLCLIADAQEIDVYKFFMQ